MISVSEIRAGEETRCLGVHIDGGEPVLVPLLNELPRARFRKLVGAMQGIEAGTSDEDADELIDSFFAEYLGRGVVDAMKNSDYLNLVRQWSEVSQEDAGASLGES